MSITPARNVIVLSLAAEGLLLLLVVLLLSLGTAGSAAADVGTFPGGTSVKIARDSETRAIFPIDLRKGIKRDQVKVRIVDVRQDDVPAKDLRDAVVKVRFRKTLPAVKLVFNDAQPEAGTYSVTLKLSQGKQTQFVTFTLVRESVEITTLGSMSVTTEQKWNLLDKFDWFGDLARLGETSEPTLKLRVGPDDNIAATDIAVTETDTSKGSVTGTVEPVKGGFEFKYKLRDMPIGVSEQTLEFSSPRLEDPISVTLNVTHRRPLALIGLVVLLGLIAGAGVRRWIDPTVAKYEAWLGLLDLRHTIEELSNETDDEALKAKLDKALSASRSVPRYASTQTILATTKKLEEMVASALAAQGVAGPRGIPESVRKIGGQVAERTQPYRLRVSVFFLKFARFVVLSVFLVLAAYALYADTWTGSWQQLVTVASWAFALDVTAAAVTAQLGKPGQTSAPVTG